MSRSRVFWIVFALVGVLCAVFARRSFDRVFPIVSLDLRMDRATALREARVLAERRGWGPAGAYREAASFGVDDTVRTFVELEGGGQTAFRDMLERGLYPAYAWHVRHFRPGEANETRVRFTPEGAPCGFVERLEEAAPGAALGETAARAIAEREAVETWHIALDHYTPVEASRETRPGGRVDHTFVYERTDARAGAGRYRLRLVVGGDRLTELTRYLQVPEAFTRRYEEMRSTNEGIAFASLAVVLVAYLLGGAGVGLFFLLRRRRVLWRMPMVVGLVVGGLSALAFVNTWPLTWMQYDTALSEQTFLLQLFSTAMAQFLFMGAVLVVSFMAAEGLSRTAFPRHPQLWRIWSPEAAGTLQIAGRTTAGYLLSGVEFAYLIGFYFLTLRLLGWWTPSEALVSPDVLATYVPWLAAVAPSLQAGIWEECLFRAVPLAGAALLGQAFGRRGLWIAAAMVLQAVVFGAGHANYPSEPAYARLVELIVPSLVWGLVYLAFGLLPTILTHYLFDLVLFALPLFTSTAPGGWVDRTMVVLCAVAPLGIVLVARLRAGAWRELPDTLRNGGWVPPAEAPSAPEPEPVEASPDRPRRALAAWTWGVGLAGLALWLGGAPWRTDVPPLAGDRATAAAHGRQAAEQFGFAPSPAWRTFTVTRGGPGLEDTFVWRTSGRDAYASLLGTYLDPPGWNVRLATFEGPVAERAEEWDVELGPAGAPRRVRHQLPEARPGASLERHAARILAVAALRQRLGVEPSALREVSAVSAQHQARRDWTFTWADTASHALQQGELRLAVEVAGDEVVDAHRLVHVPETWERAYRGSQSSLRVLQISRAALGILIALAGAVIAVVLWSRRRYPWRFALVTAGAGLAVLVVQALNNLPFIRSNFSTAQPWDLQNAIFITALLLVQFLVALCGGLLAGLVHGQLRSPGAGRVQASLGIAAGLVAAGAIALQLLVARGSDPVWPAFSAAQTYVPFLAEALPPVWRVFLRAAVLLAVLVMVHVATRRWTVNRIGYGVLLFVAGGILGNAGTAPGVGPWFAQAAIAGAAMLLLYVMVLRHDLTIVPALMGTLVGLHLVRVALQAAHPAALPGAFAGLVLAAAAAAAWTRALRAPLRVAPPPL